MAYLAKVDSALQTSVTGLSWFKIYEDGFTADGNSAVDRLIANKGLVSFKIPSCIKPGNYFLRAEIIALHAASSYPGAQFYMECAQINITGGGSASPATVSFPGAYAGSDPGIKINLYNPPVKDNYIIPGPRPFSCDGSTVTATTSKASTTTSQVPTTTTTKASTTTTSVISTATGTASHYSQCGGIGWTGPTVCASPYVCTKSGDYYSQCL